MSLGSTLKVVGESAFRQNIEETKAYVRNHAIANIADIGDVELNNLQNGQVLKYDSVNEKWINRNDDSGGSGLKVGDVSGATYSVTAGEKKVTLTWSDPVDVEVSGVILAEWAGTIVVRKAGSAPTSHSDGTVITTNTTRNQYSSIGYEDTNNLEYGTVYYYRFFPYTTGNLYTDGTALNAMLTRASIPIPSPNTTLTYNTSEQTMTFANYDNTKMIGAGMTGTDAGTYTATFTPLDDYMWSSDNSTGAKNVSWQISPKPVTIPEVTGSFTYDATSKNCTVDTFDPNEVEQDSSSVTSASNAGTYHVYFNLVDSQNYIWSDDSTTTKDKTWTIAKALATCTLSKNTVTLNTQTLSDTVSVSNTSGTVAVASSSADVGVTYANNIITISALGTDSGTESVTVHVSESANYEDGDFVITVELSFVDSVLNNNDWATISSISAAGTASNYWNVGDTKQVTLNGTIGTLSVSNLNLWVFILGFDHNSSIEGNGITFGCFKTAQTNGTDVGLADDKYNTNAGYTGSKYFQMNHWGSSSNPYNTNYGGWAACDMRYDILGSTNQAPSPYGSSKSISATGQNPTSTCATNPVANTLMAALPSELRSVMKPITKYTDNKGNSSNISANVTTTIDYLPLLSEYEVQGSRSYANQYEYTESKQKQYDYYANNNPKIKYRHDSSASACLWWCRSALYSGASTFCRVYTDGSANFNGSRYSLAVAPCFLV